jgi:hypothetical protein
LRFIVVASYLVDFNAAFREASNQPLQARLSAFGALAFSFGALVFSFGALVFSFGALAFGFSALAFGFGALALLLGDLGGGGHKIAVGVVQAQPVVGAVAILALPDAHPRA